MNIGFLALATCALLAVPSASAREIDADYREQAALLVHALDSAVTRGRVATAQHAFGDLSARQAAHVMRVQHEHLDQAAAQLAGLSPPPGHARDQAALAGALATFREAFQRLEICYRTSEDLSCALGLSLADAGEAMLRGDAGRLRGSGSS